jgi:hypothetical protein
MVLGELEFGGQNIVMIGDWVLVLAFPFVRIENKTRCGGVRSEENAHHELYSSTGLDLEDSTRIAYANL